MSMNRETTNTDASIEHRNVFGYKRVEFICYHLYDILNVYTPAIISLSLGSRLTVHGRNISTSLAVRTGVLEERNTSKLRMSPSISSSGSTSLVVGMFLESLKRRKGKRDFGRNKCYFFPYHDCHL